MSEFLKINGRDIIKGLIMSIIGAVMSSLMVIINNGSLPEPGQWKGIAITAIGAGLAYLVKNFFTNSEDQFAKPEPTTQG